ncbi:hypothetical protein BpOF4_00745 [Alkalihalophilus pseudofirmus OF4]|jgi:hypothetical protein|uniref:Uncharacterized protein n=2 Tax=Alkalihalophilus TaxID=2893060 RepID=D3FU16_ALKPO|nr:hypothetical protein BpOF4_00745 [Alkalihalophilus pseudofirmus OF4]ERN53247.1 hypothetical protein A33I_12925 [Alkalihalophilus marmarensis DSM 21297]
MHQLYGWNQNLILQENILVPINNNEAFHKEEMI